MAELTEQRCRHDLPKLDAGSWARFLTAVPGATAMAGDGPAALQAKRLIEWGDGSVGPAIADPKHVDVDLFGGD